MIDYSRKKEMKELIDNEELFENINKLENETYSLMEEGLLEKDENYFNKEKRLNDFNKERGEARKIINTLEINNLQGYAYYYKNEAKKIRDKYIEEKDKIDFTPEEINNIETKVKSNLIMANSIIHLFDLTSLIEFCNNKAGKYKPEKYQKAKKRAIERLENNKFTFHDPTYIETSLDTIFDNKKDIRTFAMKFYMYINTLPLTKNNLINILLYFLILALNSIEEPEMKKREELIENIKKCI